MYAPKYTLDEPHPNYGKDPNILNEFGHTDYPKWIDHPTEKTKHPVIKDKEIPLRILVQDKNEEAEVKGNMEEEEVSEENKSGTKKNKKSETKTWGS